MNVGAEARSVVRTVDSRDVGEFTERVSESFAPLNIQTNHAREFRGRIRGRRLGDVEVFDVRATQHRIERGE